ncbi:molybdopterin-binding protein [Luteococcus sp. H138]|uniref:MogA/MoaB family molybdenum cofactor biosynthesis protein n=1 Tax=unclassified Luteococcus TaxID=2639923 RepID=UPI00313B91E9
MTSTTPAQIIVVSDRALGDPDENRAGPVIAAALEAAGCEVATSIVASDAESVAEALQAAVASVRVVVTTGGTGIRPGDVVSDQTAALGLVELPGIAEEIRRRGAAKTSVALLSRARAGLVETAEGRVLVLNAPSSRGGAKDVSDLLGELLPDLLRDLDGRPR